MQLRAVIILVILQQPDLLYFNPLRLVFLLLSLDLSLHSVQKKGFDGKQMF